MASPAAATASASPAAVLARNQLSSLLAQAFPDDLASSGESRRSFLAQLPAVRAVLSRHNVLGRVRDGKALGKFHSKLLQLIDAPELQAAGWELALVVVSQCALDTLETLAPALQSRAVRSAKALASTKQETSDDDALAFAVACRVCAVALRGVGRFAPDVRRDLLDALAKQLVPSLLSFLLSALEQPETSDAGESVCTEALKFLCTALDAAPSSMRSHATKIESVSVAALFRSDVSGAIALSVGINANGSEQPKVSPLTRAAAACLSKLPAASDKPLQAWTHMAQKAVEALHAQLDLLAGKRSTTNAASSSSVPTNLKIWMRHASSSAVDMDLSALERGDACALLFSRAADALTTVMTSRIVSEREVQAVLVDIIAVARRALATRAHEVGKHTGVSKDGERLPVSVVYGVLPNVHASALQVLSSVVGRAGICSLRYAGRITRTLQLAVENLRLEAGASYNAGGSTLGSSSSRALYDAIAVCVTTMGASTVERLGTPLLTELVAQCQTQLVDPTAPSVSAQASANSVASGDKKGKKRKRQQASGVPDVSQLNAALATDAYVSEYDRRERASNAHAALAAVATCVAVYGSLLPESERRAASEIAIVAATNCADKSASVNASAANAVALAMLTDAVTCDAASAHGGNLLNGMESWQHLATRRTAFGASEGGSSDGVALSVLLPLAALNAGEALLHPRAPPFVVNVASLEEETSGAHLLQKRLETGASSSSVFLSSRRGAQSTPVRGDADDWHATESALVQSSKTDEENDESEQAKNDDDEAKAPVVVVDEEEEDQEEEDYEDERPAKKANASTDEDSVEVEDGQQASSDGSEQGGEEAERDDEQEPSDSGVKASKADEENDDDDDEFPDIVMDDEDEE